MIEGFARVAGVLFLPDDTAAVDRALVAGETLASRGRLGAGPGGVRPGQAHTRIRSARARAPQAASSSQSPPAVKPTIAKSTHGGSSFPHSPLGGSAGHDLCQNLGQEGLEPREMTRT